MSLTNDAAGNLTINPLARNIGDGSGGIPSPSGQTYEYDEENRLKAVKRGSDLATLLSMKYDALGRRVESTDHTAASDPCDGTYQPVRTRHVAAGIETLAEFIECPTGSPPATAWVKAREFVWGAAFPEPLAMIDWTEAGAAASGTAEALHYVHQHLGSPAALTNASREAVERYTYDPYGRTTIENAAGTRLTASAFGNPFAWTGQRYDAGVKLYHFLFRSYSPELGRWMQRDPLGYADSVSLYNYGSGTPLLSTDPFGLLLRDREGNIIVIPNGQPVKAAHPSGDTAILQPVTVFANDGTAVRAYQCVQGGAGWITDCHGTTFADKELWINDDQVLRILSGDGYVPVPTGHAQPGDVVVMVNTRGQIVHSVTVALVNPFTGEILAVFGQGGLEEFSHFTSLSGAWTGGVSHFILRSKENYVQSKLRELIELVNTFWKELWDQHVAKDCGGAQ